MSQKLNVTVNKMAIAELNRIEKEKQDDKAKEKGETDSCEIDSIITVEGDFEVVVCSKDDIK